MSSTDVSQQLAELMAERADAGRRVDELEAQQRAAAQDLAATRAALVAAERTGNASASGRAALEKQLRLAEQRVAEPWAPRLDGARQALRDQQLAVVRFVEAHLLELVEALEAEGAAVAEGITAHARAIEADYARWNQLATEISGLCAVTTRMRPGDVSRTRPEGDRLRKACAEFIMAGGELGPQLSRDSRAAQQAAALA